jgi:hypothetical protein
MRPKIMPSAEFIAWAGFIVALVAAFFGALQWASAYRSAAEARRSADAAEKQASEAERTRLIQAEAMRTQAEDTAKALSIAQESGDAAKASAAALAAQAKDTHDALEIARQSVLAAERLAEANEALAIAGQRGWLIIVDAQATPDHAELKVVVRSQFQFRNVGKTPIGKILLRHCEKVLGDDPKDYAGLTLERYATLAPNAEILIRPICECSLQDFSKIKRREATLYFYGNAMYEDIFGHSHGISWRWAFDGDNLIVCEKGNAFKASYEETEAS